MAFTKLTLEGEAFIKHHCSGSGNSALKGKGSSLPDGGALPKQLLGTGKPQLSPDYLWEANVYDDSNRLITTNDQLALQLIKWYNYYAKEYEIDANIIAAQGFAESAYKVWVFPQTSDAGGISQFTIDTMIDIILKNKHNVTPKFTDGEIGKLFDIGFEPSTRRQDITYRVTINKNPNRTGRENRATLHQNVINNPKLMIKAQCRYMKYIANNCDSYANWTLFGYAAGVKYTKIYKNGYVKSFIEAVQLAEKDGNRHAEGVSYIFKIFGILGDKNNVNVKFKSKGQWFGYGPDKLRGLDNQSINMGVKMEDQLAYFDAHSVNVMYTNNIYD